MWRWGQWSGPNLRAFLDRIGADLTAKYIGFRCADGYTESIDMPQGRVRQTDNDRWFFVQLYRWFPSILMFLTIIQPEKLVRWHRASFRCYWRWKSR